MHNLGKETTTVNLFLASTLLTYTIGMIGGIIIFCLYLQKIRSNEEEKGKKYVRKVIEVKTDTI